MAVARSAPVHGGRADQAEAEVSPTMAATADHRARTSLRVGATDKPERPGTSHIQALAVRGCTLAILDGGDEDVRIAVNTGGVLGCTDEFWVDPTELASTSTSLNRA